MSTSIFEFEPNKSDITCVCGCLILNAENDPALQFNVRLLHKVQYSYINLVKTNVMRKGEKPRNN